MHLVVGYLGYLLYDNMISEHGPTKIYNDCLDLVRTDPKLVLANHPTVKDKETDQSRNHSFSVDNEGRNKLFLRFYIEGSNPSRLGVIQTSLIESPNTQQWNYQYIIVDVYDREALDKSDKSSSLRMRQRLARQTPVDRIEVLVTIEYKSEIQRQKRAEKQRAYQSRPKLKTDGSWFGLFKAGGLTTKSANNDNDD
ncbi:Mitochondrial import inner membrane translocase subunit Tim21 [Mycoemilia scoparia]|uniref:Mitochondrial import inner membrane translocase subunit Tim21 n=1 Tax=Mycoemilia scoparia TaxID=417184 RepID=A0A9W7ZXH7_9FUNG|nr:Mitochondrial import inner membrane translocase subunit Tim21 [Mycoemilia scoparia]